MIQTDTINFKSILTFFYQSYTYRFKISRYSSCSLKLNSATAIFTQIETRIICLLKKFSFTMALVMGLTCPNLPKLVQICPNLPFLLFCHCFDKKMWSKNVFAWLNLALVISLNQCIGACWEFALELIELPFIFSGVCSPSEANYFSNPFEVFCWYSFSRNYIHEFFSI